MSYESPYLTNGNSSCLGDGFEEETTMVRITIKMESADIVQISNARLIVLSDLLRYFLQRIYII